MKDIPSRTIWPLALIALAAGIYEARFLVPDVRFLASGACLGEALSLIVSVVLSARARLEAQRYGIVIRNLMLEAELHAEDDSLAFYMAKAALVGARVAMSNSMIAKLLGVEATKAFHSAEDIFSFGGASSRLRLDKTFDKITDELESKSEPLMELTPNDARHLSLKLTDMWRPEVGISLWWSYAVAFSFFRIMAKVDAPEISLSESATFMPLPTWLTVWLVRTFEETAHPRSEAEVLLSQAQRAFFLACLHRCDDLQFSDSTAYSAVKDFVDVSNDKSLEWPKSCTAMLACLKKAYWRDELALPYWLRRVLGDFDRAEWGNDT